MTFISPGKNQALLKSWPAPKELCLSLSGYTPILGLKNGRPLARGQKVASSCNPCKGDLHAPLAGTIKSISAQVLVICPNEKAGGEPPVPLKLDDIKGETLGRTLASLGLDLPLSPQPGDPVILSALCPQPGDETNIALWSEQIATIKIGINTLARLWPNSEFLEITPPFIHPSGLSKNLIFSKKYPQTLPPFLKKNFLGRYDRLGQGVLDSRQIFMIGTIARNGLPLIASPITIQKSSYLVPLGLKLSELLEHTNLSPLNGDKVILGGLMTGKCTARLDYGLTQKITAVHLSKAKKKHPPSTCRRCSRCRKACPLNLPIDILGQKKAEDWPLKARTELLKDCPGCGLCALACPAGRPLLTFHPVETET